MADEILKLFYADEPILAFELLQKVKGTQSKAFLESEEVKILEKDFECLSEFRKE